METWEWIVVGVAAALVLLLAAAFVRIRRRRHHLKERFGVEYQRAVAQAGTAGGEKRLTHVEHEREDLELRSLSTAARDRYLEEWRHVEVRFVSDPQDAARAAERLIARALEEQGYPEEDDKERLVALVSVDHPDVAERYRHAYSMLDTVDGGVATENLRKAMLDFRTVLEDLLQHPRAAA